MRRPRGAHLRKRIENTLLSKAFAEDLRPGALTSGTAVAVGVAGTGMPLAAPASATCERHNEASMGFRSMERARGRESRREA